jgi:NADH-quinone oxidoreductase subunit N
LTSLTFAFISLPFVFRLLPRQVTQLLILDQYAFYYLGLIIGSSLFIGLLAVQYFEGYDENREEFYLLLLLATLGSGILVASDHFAAFFLGLEILSVSLYVMIAYTRFRSRRIEAAIKYLVLAGATAAFMLFGIALIYASSGTLSFSESSNLLGTEGDSTSLLLLGWGLLIVGLGFKLALVPFHIWTPDVYQGAPAPVTAFIATVSKGGVFALALRYFVGVSLYQNRSLWGILAVVAVASMLFGNLLALLQNNIKRILAYSSIAHLGYLMVGLLASGSLGPKAVAFYLTAYFVTTLSAFGVVTLLSTPDQEFEQLSDYLGLFQQRPGLTLVMTAALLSLAGIPPTAGLVGKIYIVAAGVGAKLWLLLIVLVVASVVAVFYYIRVVITMFRRRGEGSQTLKTLPPSSLTGGVVLGVLMVLLVGLGLYPTPVFRLIERMMDAFVSSIGMIITGI